MHISYHRLSEAKNVWNYNRQQLDLACEEVDARTHTIIHPENAIEQ
jgi:hypothetical protein